MVGRLCQHLDQYLDSPREEPGFRAGIAEKSQRLKCDSSQSGFDF
jgi:hypothetical protein